LEPLVPEEVHADGEDVRPPVVQAERDRAVADEGIVQRERGRGADLDAVDAERIDLLDGEDLLAGLARSRRTLGARLDRFAAAGEIVHDVAAAAFSTAAFGAAA